MEFAQNLEKICRLAVDKFNADLDVFWCGYDNKVSNVPSERNLLLHLANAFHENNYHCYSEVGYKGKTENQRVDLVTISKPLNNEIILIAIEIKNFFGAEKAIAVLEDVEKIEAYFNYVSNTYSSKNKSKELDLPYKVKSKYGVIVAIAWDNNPDKSALAKERWTSNDDPNPSISKLQNKLQQMKSRNFTFPSAGNFHEHYKDTNQYCHILVSVFEVG